MKRVAFANLLLLIFSVNIASGFPIKLCNIDKDEWYASSSELKFEVIDENDYVVKRLYVQSGSRHCVQLNANDFADPVGTNYKILVSTLCQGLYSCILEEQSSPIIINSEHDIVITGQTQGGLQVRVIQDIVPPSYVITKRY